ncbi:MAG: hypothetical protein D6696_11400 [Acidobacteria bacterium]|nr:MAG: hypothetical protein D6696_11400 [Acidobacteriota bacterium]
MSTAAGDAPAVPGIDPWRLGMSRQEVIEQTDYGPYAEVRSTGGLETFAGRFDGESTHVSFVFADDRLIQIQVWAYQGDDVEKALASFAAACRYLARDYGTIYRRGEPIDVPLDAASLRRLIPETMLAAGERDGIEKLREAGEVALTPQEFRLYVAGPPGTEIYASFIRVLQLDLSYVFVILRQRGS